MKNQILKPLVIALMLALVSLSIPAAQAAHSDKNERGEKDYKCDKCPAGPTGPACPAGAAGPAGPAGSFPVGTATGDMLYWNGTAWVMIPAGENNTTLKNCDGVFTWVVTSCPGYFQIGDRGPAGGLVFYLTDATGKHGLEAAPVDQGGAEWGCIETEIAGGDGIAFGTGAQNTADILAGCNTAGIAAQIADAYSYNGVDDWYLPSIDELRAMRNSIGPTATAPFTNVGGFGGICYWSSSEIDLSLAFVYYTAYPQNDICDGYKSVTFSVRAIRAF